MGRVTKNLKYGVLYIIWKVRAGGKQWQFDNNEIISCWAFKSKYEKVGWTT